MFSGPIAFIDHYDSFSMNVIQLLKSEAQHLQVRRVFSDDNVGLQSILASPIPIVLSPGPKRPEDVPVVLDLAQKLLGKTPMLGICLGHQILGHLHGSTIRQLADPHHGTTVAISGDPNDPLFRGVPRELEVATYNSLVISRPKLGKVIAVCLNDGSIQAVRYPYQPPTYGLQFHPEAFLSQHGNVLIRNWLDLCGGAKFDDFINQVNVTDATVSR